MALDDGHCMICTSSTYFWDAILANIDNRRGKSKEGHGLPEKGLKETPLIQRKRCF
jgi:hypothetical protein